MKTDIRYQMNAEKPDDVLADLEAKRGMWRVDYYRRNGCIVSQWFQSKRAAQARFAVLDLKGKEPELWKENNP